MEGFPKGVHWLLLRGGDVSVESLDVGKRVDAGGAPEQRVAGGGNGGVPSGESSRDEEREKRVEQWMQNIREFIRGIDVSSL